MDTAHYHSYVVRAWDSGAPGMAVGRVLVDEIQSGRQVELRGDAGRKVVDALLEAVHAVDGGGTLLAGDAPGPAPSPGTPGDAEPGC